MEAEPPHGEEDGVAQPSSAGPSSPPTRVEQPGDANEPSGSAAPAALASASPSIDSDAYTPPEEQAAPPQTSTTTNASTTTTTSTPTWPTIKSEVMEDSQEGQKMKMPADADAVQSDANDENRVEPHEEKEDEEDVVKKTEVKTEVKEEKKEKEEEEGEEEEQRRMMEELRDEVTGRWTIMVANVNKELGPEEVEQHLQRTIPFWNDLHCEVILMQHKNLASLKNRGVAHLELSSSEAAARLYRYLIESSYSLGEAPLRVDWRRPERKDESMRAVYVANAPVTITKDDVRELFERFGEIESVFLSSELPKKQRRDWLVVTYTNHESAVEAIRTMHGHLLNGYKMVLTFYVQSGKKNTDQQPASPPGMRASKKARYDFYCEKCDVVCSTAEMLHEHLASRIHQMFRSGGAGSGKASNSGQATSSSHRAKHHDHHRAPHHHHHYNDDRRGRQGNRRQENDPRHGDRRGGHDGHVPVGGNSYSRKRGRDNDGGYHEEGRHDRREWRSPPPSRHRHGPDGRWLHQRGQRDGGREEERWHAGPSTMALPPILVASHMPSPSSQPALALPLALPQHQPLPLNRCQLCDGFGHTAKECPSFARAHPSPSPSPAASAAAPATAHIHAGIYTTAYAHAHAAAAYAAAPTAYTTTPMAAYISPGGLPASAYGVYTAAPAATYPATAEPYHHPHHQHQHQHQFYTAAAQQPQPAYAHMIAASLHGQASTSPSGSAYYAAAAASSTPAASAYGPHPRPNTRPSP